VRRPGVWVGVLMVAVLIYIGLNTLRTEGPGSRGVEAGTELPAFAVPLALSDLEGDANVSGRACDVRGPKILNSCELAEQGPVVLGFFAEPSQRCDDEIDRLDALRARFPGVQFAAVAIRGSRADLRRRVRDRGWELPVGHDRDGAVANLYGVAVCPTIVLARRGGRVVRTVLGSPDEADLEADVEGLGALVVRRGGAP
jgi:thiol-disulfide isomerase/thioredoxin